MRAVGAALVAALVLGGCAETRGDPSPPPAGTASTSSTPARPRPAAGPVLCRTRVLRQVGRVEDPAMDELSGLVRSPSRPGLLWAQEDSGAPPVLTALSTTGAVRGHLTVTGAQAVDWEDLAAGPGADGTPTLWVGDIGDNRAERDAVQVYRVAEPDPAAAATGPAARLTLRYPDGAHDAEALLLDAANRRLVVVTKALLGGRAYSAPSDAPAGSALTLARGPAIPLGLVTAGDVSPDGRTIALRTYDELAVWRRAGDEPLTTALARAPCRGKVDLGVEGQGEALALAPDGRTALSSTEGERPPLRRIGAG